METSERLRARTFNEYTLRPHQEIGQTFNNLHNNLQPYSSSTGLNFMANTTYMHFPTLSPSYSPYSPPYTPSSSSSPSTVLFSYSGSNPMPYSIQPPPRGATLPSQHRISSRNYESSSVPSHNPTNQTYVRSPSDCKMLLETEEQDSVNRDSGQSEPMDPPLDGYPDVREFDELMKRYDPCFAALCAC